MTLVKVLSGDDDLPDISFIDMDKVEVFLQNPNKIYHMVMNGVTYKTVPGSDVSDIYRYIRGNLVRRPENA